MRSRTIRELIPIHPENARSEAPDIIPGRRPTLCLEAINECGFSLRHEKTVKLMGSPNISTLFHRIGFEIEGSGNRRSRCSIEPMHGRTSSHERPCLD